MNIEKAIDVGTAKIETSIWHRIDLQRPIIYAHQDVSFILLLTKGVAILTTTTCERKKGRF